MGEHTEREMMAISAGRLIKDGDVLFAGTGVSMLAATVSKKIHAPRAIVFFETGGIDPTLDELPMAVADSRVMDGSAMNSGLIEAFSIVGHRKFHSVAFLGAAQIDRYGNLNSTCLGDYEKPKVRFPGSGGACDAASLASGVIVFMQIGRSKFVEKLDYLTSPRLAPGRRFPRESGVQTGRTHRGSDERGRAQIPRDDEGNVPRRVLSGGSHREHHGKRQLSPRRITGRRIGAAERR